LFNFTQNGAVTAIIIAFWSLLSIAYFLLVINPNKAYKLYGYMLGGVKSEQIVKKSNKKESNKNSALNQWNSEVVSRSNNVGG
jgi:hypothetical protein